MSPEVTFRPVTTTTSNLPVHLLARVNAKAEKMGKRLARLGAPAPTVEHGPVVSIEEHDEFGREFHWDAYETVTVTGVEAMFAGWRPIAALDHTLAADEALIALFPAAIADGETCPDRYRFRGPVCDHCRIKIRRNTTVVFVHDNGDWTQVGSTCILDFIGVDPTTLLMLQDTPLGTEDDDEAWGGGGATYLAPLNFLAVAAEVTLRDGFTPTSTPDPYRTPTKHIVSAWFSSKDPMMSHGFTDTAAGTEMAAAIMEWLPTAGSSEFMCSARLAVRSDRVTHRTEGIIAALPFVYQKALGQLAEKAQQFPPSVHIGKVGDKITFTGTVIKALTIDGYYGPKRLISVRNDEGVIVSSFSTSQSAFDIEAGETVTVTGAIKDHDDSGYGKQTMLIRCKFVVSQPALLCA